MAMSTADKAKVVEDYQRSPGDTGSPEVQVAILSSRIATLTEHFKGHKKDNHSRLGLLKMVGKRRRLLNYLKDHKPDGYKQVIKELGLRR